MMDVTYTLLMHDGTKFENSQCGYFENTLWLYLKDITFVDAIQRLSDPNIYSTVIFDITDEYRTVRTTYSGLTRIESAIQRLDGVDVCIKGEHVIVTEEIIKDEGGDSEDATIHNSDLHES